MRKTMTAEYREPFLEKVVAAEVLGVAVISGVVTLALGCLMTYGLTRWSLEQVNNLISLLPK